MYIKVDTNLLTNKQKALNDSINLFFNELNNIKNNTSNIANVWQGNDFDNFNNKINDFVNDLNKFKETLIQYTEFIQGYTKATDVLDDYYANKKISIK